MRAFGSPSLIFLYIVVFSFSSLQLPVAHDVNVYSKRRAYESSADLSDVLCDLSFPRIWYNT